jgi:tRNA-dihydrouridine synthase A
MLGRAAYHEPGILGEADRRVFGDDGSDVGPFEAVERHLPYVRSELARGAHLAGMTRHMLGLFHGLPGARAWRRTLTVEAVRPGAGIEVIERALAEVREAGERLSKAVAA